MRCAVNNCGNNNRYSNRSKWRFFHFPRERTLLKKWVDFCERDNINSETAFICNEHFTPKDFQRNMQYELGFTRRNPTKLKPNSYPTGNRPQKVCPKPIEYPPLHQEKAHSPVQDAYKVVEVGCDLLVDSLDQSSSSNDYADHLHLEIEIIDSLDPPSKANDHVEIINSKGVTYEKHLDDEVCSLKKYFSLKRIERNCWRKLQIFGNLFNVHDCREIWRNENQQNNLKPFRHLQRKRKYDRDKHTWINLRLE